MDVNTFFIRIYSFIFVNDFYFSHNSWFTVFSQFSAIQQGCDSIYVKCPGQTNPQRQKVDGWLLGSGSK